MNKVEAYLESDINLDDFDYLNEHSIVTLIDKNFEQQELVKLIVIDDKHGFEEFTGSYDPDDYIFSRAGSVDPSGQKYLEDWWFRDARPAYQSKLN